jgi:hypothetical protein
MNFSQLGTQNLNNDRFSELKKQLYQSRAVYTVRQKRSIIPGFKLHGPHNTRLILKNVHVEESLQVKVSNWPGKASVWNKLHVVTSHKLIITVMRSNFM